MQKYSISEASKALSIPKDTLRYYDKLGLVSPTRGDNRYRYYSDIDMLSLQYIEVMKYAGFSLAEIQAVLQNRQNGKARALDSTVQLLANKRREIEQRIKLYNVTLTLLKKAEQVMERKVNPGDAREMNEQVKVLFKELRQTEI